VRYWLDSTSDGTEPVVPLFDAERGCEPFTQRLLCFGAGRSGARSDPVADETLYVLDGEGSAAIGEAEVELRPGVGVFVRQGASWSVDARAPLELLSVLVHHPEPAPAGDHAVADLIGESRLDATAARQFALGITAERGCPSVTQFIGFVPPGRAPDHFHRYDEVLYVLEGEGTLHIDGEEAPLRRGVCVHLPARLVHCLANTGDSEMLLLGVFRPSGSPAEAYYPDGTPAVYPGEAA
jgi:mannose-6-phosphate isomerase-like protein (cupin superfamily)